MKNKMRKIIGNAKAVMIAAAMVLGAMGAWTASAANVARIGSTYYTSFSDALTAVQTGETITLVSNCSTDNQRPCGKNFTIDGDGHTLSKTAASSDWNMIISGHYDASYSTTQTGQPCNITVTNIVFSGCTRGRYFALEGGSTLNIMSDVVFDGGTATWDGAAVSVDNGTLNLYGGIITNMTASNYGAVYLVDSTKSKLNVYGGVVRGNTCGGVEMNVVLKSATQLTLGGDFTGNIGIWYASGYTAGSQFGVNTEGYTGAQYFTNDKDQTMCGTTDGNRKLVWAKRVSGSGTWNDPYTPTTADEWTTTQDRLVQPGPVLVDFSGYTAGLDQIPDGWDAIDTGDGVYAFVQDGYYAARVGNVFYTTYAAAEAAAGENGTISIIRVATITLNSSRQRYPWNGIVDISYTISKVLDSRDYAIEAALTMNGVTKSVILSGASVDNGVHTVAVDVSTLFTSERDKSAKLKLRLVDKGRKE